MLPIALDRSARLALIDQVSARSKVHLPLRWHEFLDQLSIEISGRSSIDLSWSQALTGKAQLFSWHLSPETIATAVAHAPLIYMCWGVPDRKVWKNTVLKIVLRRAKHVLANDRSTVEEIRVLSGRTAHLVPFFIDADYFEFGPRALRERFLFCNGGNDRDTEVLLSLAHSGFKVRWLINDPVQRTRYSGRHPNLVCLSQVSFSELRRLYQTCAVAVFPALRDAHAAGQTTGMEAVACGAPLVLSSGRTASIFSGLPSVSVVASRSGEAWAGAVNTLLAKPRLETDTASAAQVMRQRSNRENVAATLSPFLSAESGVQIMAAKSPRSTREN
jgi:Glycosyl transferases group 1